VTTRSTFSPSTYDTSFMHETRVLNITQLNWLQLD